MNNNVKCPYCGNVLRIKLTISSSQELDDKNRCYLCQYCGFNGNKNNIDLVNKQKEEIIDYLMDYSGIATLRDVRNACKNNDSLISYLVSTGYIKEVNTHDGKSWLVLQKDIERVKLSKGVDITIEFDTDLDKACAASGYHIEIVLDEKKQNLFRDSVFKFAKTLAEDLTKDK
jgi:hypothetical protein